MRRFIPEPTAATTVPFWSNELPSRDAQLRIDPSRGVAQRRKSRRQRPPCIQRDLTRTTPPGPRHPSGLGVRVYRGRLNADGTLVVRVRMAGDTQIKIPGMRRTLLEIELPVETAAGGLIDQAVVTPLGKGTGL